MYAHLHPLVLLFEICAGFLELHELVHLVLQVDVRFRELLLQLCDGLFGVDCVEEHLLLDLVLGVGQLLALLRELILELEHLAMIVLEGALLASQLLKQLLLPRDLKLILILKVLRI